jgi:hypothetical protein
LKAKFSQPVLFGALLIAAVACAPPPRASAQDVLLPDQSAAKAKQIIKEAIDALGGATYMNVHDVTCTGHLGQFDHSGELTGYEKFIDYAEPPLKDRTENLPQRNEIDVFNGDAGWNLDRGGVSPEPAGQVAQFQEDIKKDLDNILRHRVDEPGMVIRYDGQDIVDLKQVDWVQLIDSDNRTIRIAFDRSTHLPIRKTVESRDPKTRLTTHDVEYYSLFFLEDGVQTPKQITRERNNMKVFQVFFDKCDYNTGLQDALFTKQSLDDRWAKMPNKDKYHDKKKKNDKDKDKDDSSDSDDKN